MEKYRLIRFLYSFYLKIKLAGPRLEARFKKKTLVHFLHLGKTGGTSIKSALKCKKTTYSNNQYIIFCHSHLGRLKDTRPGEKVFFFVRNPIERFVSGFYSRKRKGMPRIYSEWNAGEKKAFKKFQTPNQLAVSLSAEDKAVRAAAVKAFEKIRHVNSSYWDWFENSDYFLKRINNIVFAGTTKNLNQDFLKLKKIFKLPEELKLPTNQAEMHKNPEHLDKNLEPQAIKNLRSWYDKDFQFIKLLKKNGWLTAPGQQYQNYD